MYIADDTATALGYSNNGQDNRRKLANHWHEYLVWSGIAENDNRILPVFSGDGPESAVFLQSSTCDVEISLLGDLQNKTPIDEM